MIIISSFVNIQGSKQHRLAYQIENVIKSQYCDDSFSFLFMSNCQCKKQFVLYMISSLFFHAETFFYFFQKKCMQYWPEESGECGPFFIIIRNSEQFNNYVVRQMIIRKVCTTNSKHNIASNETYKKLSQSSKQLQFSISNGIQTLCLDCTIIVQERNI